jgi:hypothetical protein
MNVNALEFEVIDKADTKTKFMIKVILHINKSKPILNELHAAKYKNDKGTFIKQLNTIIIARQILEVERSFILLSNPLYIHICHITHSRNAKNT